jgi:hypothetical protein
MGMCRIELEGWDLAVGTGASGIGGVAYQKKRWSERIKITDLPLPTYSTVMYDVVLLVLVPVGASASCTISSSLLKNVHPIVMMTDITWKGVTPSDLSS